MDAGINQLLEKIPAGEYIKGIIDAKNQAKELYSDIGKDFIIKHADGLLDDIRTDISCLGSPNCNMGDNSENRLNEMNSDAKALRNKHIKEKLNIETDPSQVLKKGVVGWIEYEGREIIEKANEVNSELKAPPQ